MACRPRLLAGVVAIAVATGCGALHRPQGGLVEPAGLVGRDPSASTSPAQTATTADSATTTPLTGTGPTAIAARFALAYLDSPPGDEHAARRQRCRPFDTDDLDEALASSTWDGATNPPGDQDAVATIDAINQVDSNAQGVGYELTATVTTKAVGHQPEFDRLDVQLWVTATIDGWRVSQVAVT